MAEFDVVIHGGRVIDGAGNPWCYADVAIKDGKIAALGKIDPNSGQRAISAKGRVVTPGFIDMHTHTISRWWPTAMRKAKCARGSRWTSSARAKQSRP